MGAARTAPGLRRALLLLLLPLVGGHADEQGARAVRRRLSRAGRQTHFLGFAVESAPAEPQPAGPRGAPTQYYGLVRVGDPAQEFRVVFDTSSGQLILPGSKCGDTACDLHRKFRSENSTSAKQIGWADDPTTPIGDSDDRDTKSLSFLGSDVSGEFVRDRVCVGSTGQLCGVADFVALTEEADEPFSQLEFDGVLGLAPTSPDSQEFNVLHALVGTASSQRGIFGVYLSQASDGPTGKGELLLGGFRRERMAEEPIWAPISNNGSWQILVQDITIGGKAAGLCGETGCLTAVDTGASLIMSPGNMLWAITSKLGIDDECASASPSLGFIVQGQHLELEKSDYLERDQDGCRLLLASLNDLGKGHPTLVLGYPFLRKHYTIFDLAQSRVGFARAVHTEQDAAQPAPDGAAAVTLIGLRP